MARANTVLHEPDSKHSDAIASPTAVAAAATHFCVDGNGLQAMVVGSADHAASDLTTVAHHELRSRL
jgi:hypothetical protein